MNSYNFIKCLFEDASLFQYILLVFVITKSRLNYYSVVHQPCNCLNEL